MKNSSLELLFFIFAIRMFYGLPTIALKTKYEKHKNQFGISR